MSKPRKKEINLTKDSVLALLQEVYNELVWGNYNHPFGKKLATHKKVLLYQRLMMNFYKV